MPILTESEWLGQTVAERYRLDEILSVGGMGVLFRATDSVTGERVAVKMLKPAFALDHQRVARFLRETRIAASLQSEHVAKVLSIWQDAAEVPFLIMELLEGRSLEEELEARRTLSFEETLAIAVPVANALQAAHRAGIVHRDVKPANIFLCDAAPGTPVVKLLDFGIAKNDEDDFETQTGAVLGTPSYMAPEQAQHGDSGPYTDVWGLGAVIYRCLVGHPPHAGDSSRVVLAKVLREPVAPLVAPGVSRLVCSVVDRALAREPHHRYPDVEALMHALTKAKARAETTATEHFTAETLATKTVHTEIDTDGEIEGATSPAASSASGRSLRPLGFMVLGAALATSLLVSSPPAPSRAVLFLTAAERPRADARSATPAAGLGPLASTAALQAPISGAGANAPQPQPAKPDRSKRNRTSVRPVAPPNAPRTPAPAQVEHDSKSGLVVVTEW